MQASSFTKSRKLLRCSTFQLWAMSCKAVCITSRFCWLVNSTAKPPTRSTRANSLNTEGYKRWFSSKDPNCLPKGKSVMILSTEASDNGNPPKAAALARSNCNGPPLRWFLRPREAMFEAAMRSCSGSKSQPIKTPGNHNWKQLSSKIAVLAFVKVRFNKFQPDKPFLQKKHGAFASIHQAQITSKLYLKPCCLFLACIRPVERSFTEEHLVTMMPIQVLLGQFSCFPSLKRNRSVRLLGHTVDPRPHLGGTDPSNVPGPRKLFTMIKLLHPRNDARLCSMDAQTLLLPHVCLVASGWTCQLGLLPMQWLGGGLQESTGGVKT